MPQESGRRSTSTVVETRPDPVIFQTTRLIPANPLIVTRSCPILRRRSSSKSKTLPASLGEGDVTAISVAGGGAGGWGGAGGNNVSFTAFGDGTPLVLPKERPFVIKHIPLPKPQADLWWRKINGIALKCGYSPAIPILMMDCGPVVLDLPNIQVVADGDPQAALKVSHQIEQPPTGSVAERHPQHPCDLRFRRRQKILARRQSHLAATRREESAGAAKFERVDLWRWKRLHRPHAFHRFDLPVFPIQRTEDRLAWMAPGDVSDALDREASRILGWSR